MCNTCDLSYNQVTARLQRSVPLHMTLHALQNTFGGTILDSGTTFTYLPPEVFERIRDSVAAYAEGRGLYRIEGPDPNVSGMLCCVVLAGNHAQQWCLACSGL